MSKNNKKYINLQNDKEIITIALIPIKIYITTMK